MRRQRRTFIGTAPKPQTTPPHSKADSKMDRTPIAHAQTASPHEEYASDYCTCPEKHEHAQNAPKEDRALFCVNGFAAVPAKTAGTNGQDDQKPEKGSAQHKEGACECAL
jgi:hypothetical protein